MRSLTSEELALISSRRALFEGFLAERMPVLVDFMQKLELPDPDLVLVDAERFLPPLDQWLTHQTIRPEDSAWIVARLGYFIGEYLVQRLGGCWFLDEMPDTAFFGRYVVGQFARVRNANAMADPVAIAQSIVEQSPGRSIARVLQSAVDELEHA